MDRALAERGTRGEYPGEVLYSESEKFRESYSLDSIPPAKC
jgi:hypothetical protein